MVDKRKKKKKKKKGPQRFRRLTDIMVGPPWDPEKEIVASTTVGEGEEKKWDLFLHFIPQADGRLYLFGLDIRPSAVLFMKSMSELPSSGITARALRSIKLGEVLNTFRVRERRADPEPKLRVPADLPAAGSRPGRRGLSDEFLSWVAINYLKAAQSDPSAPIRQMQTSMGRGYPRDTIKGWVVQARKRRFLGSTTHGKAGGGPGPMLEYSVPQWEVVDDQEARDTLDRIHRKI